jgi:hypothetical protein
MSANVHKPVSIAGARALGLSCAACPAALRRDCGDDLRRWPLG